MFNVKINFLSLLVDITGEEETILLIDDRSSIKDIIEKLTSKYGQTFKKKILNSQNLLSKYIIVILNGEDIRSYHDLDTLAQEGDEIAFLPVIAGG